MICVWFRLDLLAPKVSIKGRPCAVFPSLWRCVYCFTRILILILFVGVWKQEPRANIGETPSKLATHDYSIYKGVLWVGYERISKATEMGTFHNICRHASGLISRRQLLAECIDIILLFHLCPFISKPQTALFLKAMSSTAGQRSA